MTSSPTVSPSGTEDPVGSGAAAEALRRRVEAARRQVGMQHALLTILRRRLAASPAGDAPLIEFIDPIARSNGAAESSFDPAGGRQAPSRPDTSANLAWPRRDAAAPAMVAPPGWSSCEQKDRVRRTVGFAVFGLEEAALAAAVDKVRMAQLGDAGFAPLFLTDAVRFDTFRDQGYAFEYFSPAPQPGMSMDDWRTRTLDRLRFVRRKWRLSRIVQLGRRPFDDEKLLDALDADALTPAGGLLTDDHATAGDRSE